MNNLSRYFKNENGMIFLYVAIVMLFLIVCITSIYANVIDRYSSNTRGRDLQKIYYKDIDDSESSLYANESEIIPIYNINQFSQIASGNYFEINGLIYKFNMSNTYELKEDIIVDVKEDIENINLDFNVYRYYDESINIIDNGYKVKYYYEGDYWELIAFSNEIKDTTNFGLRQANYTSNEFSIISEANYNDINDYVLIIQEKNGEIRNIYREQNKKINSLYDLRIFVNNYKNIKEDDEIYVIKK